MLARQPRAGRYAVQVGDVESAGRVLAEVLAD
jgi:hypothetical protein